MTNALMFINRINRLSSDFSSGGNVAPNKPRSDQIDIPLPSMHRRRVPSSPYNVYAGNSGQRVMSPRGSTGVGRLRFGNQGGGYGPEHIRSNLG